MIPEFYFKLTLPSAVKIEAIKDYMRTTLRASTVEYKRITSREGKFRVTGWNVKKHYINDLIYSKTLGKPHRVNFISTDEYSRDEDVQWNQIPPININIIPAQFPATSNRKSRSKSPKHNSRDYFRSTSNPFNVNNPREKPRRSLSAQQNDSSIPDDTNQMPVDQESDDLQSPEESEDFVKETALQRMLKAHKKCEFFLIFSHN